MARISQETFDKLQGQATPVQEWAQAAETRPVQRLRSTRAALNPSGTPARASTWAEVVEKVRTRQIALQNGAGALSPAKTTASSNPHVGESQSGEDLGGSN
jgi:hypothetical protein